MATQPRITVIGSYNTDLTAFTSRMPQPGETVLGTRVVTGPGGKGSNQAVAAARLNAAVSFIGRVGQDMFAESALALWRREGIDATHVARDSEAPTGVASIWVDAGGENMIVAVPGANWAITPQDVDRAEEVIAASDVLLAVLEVPLPVVQRALALARQHGVRTVLNPAPAPDEPLPGELLALVDVITPNRNEAARVAGMNTTSAEEAAQGLLNKGVKTVVLTLGSQGVLLRDEAGARRFPAFQVEPVDTTGAGDAFNGALAVALAEGQPLEKAIRFASATAALSVTRPGAADSLPGRDEVEQLLARTG